ncbi:tyrosine-type recombinase/integrase [Geomonas agri]|uniref:tyrosine-type recombinase/integrase n=1 Tax=Geomonas agri TaxID=2873702 RepID=UPI001CD2A058|nr:integrase arm-type DNA-binding domain-containing protein [Geomonas agri]
MPKRIPPLSDPQIRNAKPKNKDYKLMDGYGLFLLVTPSSGKLWRFDYRFGNKRKTMALGTYPAIPLEEARKRREDAKALLAHNIDPSGIKKAKKAAGEDADANSFEVVAREWHVKFSPSWSDSHAFWVIRRLEQYVFPDIGARPIGDLKAPDVLKVLRRIETLTLETAHRVKFVIGQVFRYAVGSGRADRDPTADLKGLLPPRSQKHHAAITEPKEVAGLLRAIDGFTGTFTVKCAMQLAPLVFLRPGELRQAEWSEFDLGAAEWNIPIERMKLKKRVKEYRAGQKHLVPLSSQAIAILQSLKALTGQSKYVFPSARSFTRPMSNMAINAALERMGYKGEMTAHGFRALARTILDEVLQCRVDLVEHQLGHAVKDPNGRAYNRTAHLSERRKMMQVWADYLEGLKVGAKVLPLKRVEI